jgi:hypothetical protein
MEAMRARYHEENVRSATALAELHRKFQDMLVQMKAAAADMRTLKERNTELTQACWDLMSSHPIFLLAGAWHARSP